MKKRGRMSEEYTGWENTGNPGGLIVHQTAGISF